VLDFIRYRQPDLNDRREIILLSWMERFPPLKETAPAASVSRSQPRRDVVNMSFDALRSPKSRWIGPMNKAHATILITLLCSFQSRSAAAQQIKLIDLSGYSIESKIPRTETFKKMNVANGGSNQSTGIFGLQIYVGASGRLFSRQSYASAYDQLHYDSVDSNSERLRFVKNEGFILTNTDAPPGKESTYVLVTTISVRGQSDGQIRCDVHMKRVLRSGEKEYIKPVPNGDILLVSSFEASHGSCTISKGNIFQNSE
jgi:hypothetical protein